MFGTSISLLNGSVTKIPQTVCPGLYACAYELYCGVGLPFSSAMAMAFVPEFGKHWKNDKHRSRVLCSQLVKFSTKCTNGCSKAHSTSLILHANIAHSQFQEIHNHADIHHLACRCAIYIWPVTILCTAFRGCIMENGRSYEILHHSLQINICIT
jgi:hypothetical protein